LMDLVSIWVFMVIILPWRKLSVSLCVFRAQLLAPSSCLFASGDSFYYIRTWYKFISLSRIRTHFCNRLAVRIRSTFIKDGVHSTRHLVHTTDGNVVGEWGVRKWIQETLIQTKTIQYPYCKTIFTDGIIKQLVIQNGWNGVTNYWILKKMKVKVLLRFQVNGTIKTVNADLVVGADGIRSTVRRLMVMSRALYGIGCIVILYLSFKCFSRNE
jgi:hypothetical protein